MLETRAIVVHVDGQHAIVQASPENGCEQCNGKGCGAGRLSGLFCSKPRQFKVSNPINARINDEVIISVAEGSVLRGIGQVYLIPLLLMVMGAVLGDAWAAEPGKSDAYAAFGALSGLISGFVVSRLVSKQLAGMRIQPYIAGLLRDEKTIG